MTPPSRNVIQISANGFGKYLSKQEFWIIVIQSKVAVSGSLMVSRYVEW